MPELHPPVDGEALVVAHLKADPALDALGVADRISTRLPPDFTAQKRIQIERVGGLPVDPETARVERIRIQVKGFGATKEEAYDVAAAAFVSLRKAAKTHALGVVTAVRQDLALQWSPDPETDAPRYLFGVVLYCHAAPG